MWDQTLENHLGGEDLAEYTPFETLHRGLLRLTESNKNLRQEIKDSFLESQRLPLPPGLSLSETNRIFDDAESFADSISRQILKLSANLYQLEERLPRVPSSEETEREIQRVLGLAESLMKRPPR